MKTGLNPFRSLGRFVQSLMVFWLRGLPFLWCLDVGSCDVTTHEADVVRCLGAG